MLRKSPFRTEPPSESVVKWELDAEFFSALSKWTLDYPEKTLDRIFKDISLAIDNGKEYLELIPDAPFPARSLVKSIAAIFQLGTKISTSQHEVKDFALEIIQWVNRVKESFDMAGNGHLTTLTWKNLSEMRSLIDEICSWAVERLNDKRWSFRNTKIEGEIADFRTRMDDAHKLFNDRSLVIVSGGLDAIIQFLWTLIFGQCMILAALENLQKTQDAHFRHILEEQERRRYLEEKLQARTVEDPSYIAQNKDPCHSDTRKEILDDIRNWIDNHAKDTSQNFLWLVGPPGSGKSAITASIVKECQNRDILGAQYFINRNDNRTTDPKLYFPTVAQQLYKRSESVEKHVHNAFKGRKFSTDTSKEAAELFLDTICKTARDDSDKPIVVVFDGLDETSRNTLRDTAEIFSQLFTRLPGYPNAKILISSRPEDEILKSFEDLTKDSARHVKKVELDINDENSRRDIKFFLEDCLTVIAKRRGLDAAVWPGDERLQKLVDNASGLFIWAVTASKYIDSRIAMGGKEALDSVLEQFNHAGMTDINHLYLTILDSAYPKETADKWNFETFRRLIGAILVVQEPMNIRQLEDFLDLREESHRPSVDVKNFVEHLRTLLVTHSDEVTQFTIPQVHKSFFDFITSTGDHIPERYCVDVDAANAEMALLCLRHLTATYSEVYSTQYASEESALKNLSFSVKYSLSQALSHIPKLRCKAIGAISNHPEVTEPSQWNMLLGRSSHPTFGPLAISVLEEHAVGDIRTSFDDHSLVWNRDGDNLSAITPTTISSSKPIYLSSGGTRVFLCPRRRGQALPITCTQQESYDLETTTSVALLTPVERINIWMLSIDGSKIAIGGDDGEVSLHSVDSPSAPVLRLDHRHKDRVTIIATSMNNSYIASGSADSTMHVWNLNTSRYINEEFDSMLHKSSVECLVFSPDEALIISCDSKYAYLWEVSTCRQISSFPFSPGSRLSVAFSPNSRLVITGSKKGIVQLWDTQTLNYVGKKFTIPDSKHKYNNKTVNGVAFRSCGTIALGYTKNAVYLWKVDQGTLLKSIPINAKRSVDAVFTPDGSQLLYSTNPNLSGILATFSMLFKSRDCKLYILNLAPLLLDSNGIFQPKWTALSPTGNLVVSAAADKILCWKLDAVKVIGNPLEGVATSINIVTFSANESHIAGVDEDGTAYLWNSTTRKLLSSLPNCAHGASSLAFTHDDSKIVATLADNNSVVLALVKNVLSLTAENVTEPGVQHEQAVPKSTFVDVDTSPTVFGSNPAAPNRMLKNVRWYPSKAEHNPVVWAYVNNHIIRVGKDRNFVIVPVG